MKDGKNKNLKKKRKQNTVTKFLALKNKKGTIKN